MVLKFITLNDKNVHRYSKNMNKPDNVHIVAFLADWCGHCVRFKPEWKKIKEHLKSKRKLFNGYIVTACDKTMGLLPCDVKPRGFPTISLYKGPNHIMDFSEERNYKNVLKFIKKNLKKNRIKTRKRGTKKRETFGKRRTNKKRKRQ